MKRFLSLLGLTFFLVIAIGVNPFAEPVNEESSEPFLTHAVREKETAYSIARMYGMGTDEIAFLNNLQDFKIVPGQRLAINSHSREIAASWYGPGFHGQKMANGARFNMHDIIVAHKNLPIGTAVLISNPANGKTIVAPVLDRGPYIEGREIDLSYGAAKTLKTINKGVAPVKMTVLAVPLKF